MASRRAGDKQKASPFPDEFSDYLSDAKKDPEYRAAFEDAQELHRVIDSLVKCRKALSLSQTEVAKRMGVRQPTVSGFETEHSDPRLSTLQRYARAVEARLIVRIDLPAHCDWVSQSRPAYNNVVSIVRLRETAHGAVSNSGIIQDWTLQPAMAAVR